MKIIIAEAMKHELSVNSNGAELVNAKVLNEESTKYKAIDSILKNLIFLAL